MDGHVSCMVTWHGWSRDLVINNLAHENIEFAAHCCYIEVGAHDLMYCNNVGVPVDTHNVLGSGGERGNHFEGMHLQ